MEDVKFFVLYSFDSSPVISCGDDFSDCVYLGFCMLPLPKHLYLSQDYGSFCYYSYIVNASHNIFLLDVGIPKMWIWFYAVGFFFFICWYTKDLEYFMILLLLVWTGYFKRHVLKFMFPPLDNGSCWCFHSELFISRTCLLIFHNLTLNFSFICPHHHPHFTHLFISSLLEHWCVFLFILFSSFVRHFMCVSLKFVARVKFF